MLKIIYKKLLTKLFIPPKIVAKFPEKDLGLYGLQLMIKFQARKLNLVYIKWHIMYY